MESEFQTESEIAWQEIRANFLKLIKEWEIADEAAGSAAIPQ